MSRWEKQAEELLKRNASLSKQVAKLFKSSAESSKPLSPDIAKPPKLGQLVTTCRQVSEILA
ncbi:MAG: hypothetical protein KAV87_38085 [Desulfobacteraceae bacterium]|nr:hypothetical protein [Desulfobacteraceae bacterium]